MLEYGRKPYTVAQVARALGRMVGRGMTPESAMIELMPDQMGQGMGRFDAYRLENPFAYDQGLVKGRKEAGR